MFPSLLSAASSKSDTTRREPAALSFSGQESKKDTQEHEMVRTFLSLIPTRLRDYRTLKKEAKAIAEKLTLPHFSASKKRNQEALTITLQKCKELKNILEGTALTFLVMADGFHKQNKFTLALEYYSHALPIFQSLEGKAAESAADTLNNMGLSYFKLSQFSKCQACYEQAIALYEHMENADAKIAETLNNRGLLLVKQGKYDLAEKEYLRALEIKKRYLGDQSLSVANTLMNLGNLFLTKQDHLDHARQYYQDACTIIKAHHGEDSDPMADFYHSIAGTYSVRGQYQQSYEYYQRELRIKIKLHGENSAPVAACLAEIGGDLQSQGKLEEAFTYIQRALAIDQQAFGEVSWQVAEDLSTVGNGLCQQGRYEESLHYHERALTIRLKIFGEESHQVAEIYYRQALVYLGQEHYPLALDTCEHALKIQSHVFGKISSIPAATLSTMGTIYKRQGDYPRALATYLEVLAIYEHISDGETNSQVAGIHMNIGSVYLKLNDAAQAFKHYEKSLALEKKVFGEDSSRIATIHHNIAQAFFDFTRYEEALPHYTQGFLLYQRLYGTEHYLTCQMQCMLGNTHAALGEMFEGERASSHAQHAATQYKEIITVNRAILAKRGQEFSMYDLAKHHAILAALARVYITQHHHKTAGDLYDEEARRTQLFFPLLSLHYSTQALEYYAYQPERRSHCAEVYQRCADIAYQRQRNTSAMKYLKRAIVLDPIPVRHTQLKQWQEVQHKQSHAMGDDLYTTLTHIEESVDAIQISILEELQTAQSLSEFIKNRVTELVITLNSILDIAFGRFIREAMPTGGSKKRSASYYPFAISHQAFVAFLTDKHLDRNDKKQARIYETLEQEQPYTYYDLKRNKTTPGLWRHSWLDKVIAISNGGKHVGLTPHTMSDDLAERTGLLAIHKLQINISYAESRFYPWTFVYVIQNVDTLSDDKAIALSAMILQLLEQKHYLAQDNVIHPLAKKYLEGASQPASQATLVQLQNDFHKQLEADFPRGIRKYASAVAALLLRRILQSSHHTLYADYCVDLHTFLYKAVTATREIILALGSVRDKTKKSVLMSLTPSTHFATSETKPDIPTLEKQSTHFTVLFNDKKTTSLCDWVPYHHWVEELAHAYRLQGTPVLAGKHYHQAAQNLMPRYPFLAFRYYHKALHCYSLCPKEWKILQEIYSSCCKEYAQQGRWQTAIHYARQGVRKLSLCHTQILSTQYAEYRLKTFELFSTIDPDIYSQLEHSKQQLLRCDYFHFKCVANPTHLRWQEKMQYVISDMLIKLRHLLDQSFTRLVSNKIYLPNKKFVILDTNHAIKFYAFSSGKQMKEKLEEREILNEDKTKISLDRDFPALYQLLEQAQPFSGMATENQWLREMIVLSNQTKHSGLALSNLETCVRVKQLLKDALPHIEKVIQVIFSALGHQRYHTQPTYAVSHHLLFLPPRSLKNTTSSHQGSAEEKKSEVGEKTRPLFQ